MPIMGQYEYQLVPKHPRANVDHQVYTHVLRAEEKIGRFLSSAEVVHHIDENKLNNSLDNLLVFQDKSNHTRFHQLSVENRELIEVEPNVFICIKKRKEKISKKCSREELKNLIRHNSFVQIGKIFGVSDNAIRKWCKSYNLPFLSRQIPLYTDEEWEKI